MTELTSCADGLAQPCCDELIALFNNLFRDAENTVLVRGDNEPVYLPADARNPHHRVIFAHGFFASALHEIAHWCIAGAARRQREDYGYWYAPDGRDAAQQRAFEQVEARPQALEWILARACNTRFRISVDNLSGTHTDPQPFRRAVMRALQGYCRHGIPPRARRLRDALCVFYGTEVALRVDAFPAAEIGLESCRGVNQRQ